MKNLFLLILFIGSFPHGHCQTNDLVAFIGECVSISKTKTSQVKVDTLSGLGIDTVYSIADKEYKLKTDTIMIVGPTILQKDVAKYKVLEVYEGNLDLDTISFFVFNNNDIEHLSNHNQVLLFLIKKNGAYHLLDNQLINVFPTKNNRWASPYSFEDYKTFRTINTDIKPYKVNFKERPVYNLDKYTNSYIKKHYPSPYFIVNQNKAIAVYGNYVEELIEVKKRAILNNSKRRTN